MTFLASIVSGALSSGEAEANRAFQREAMQNRYRWQKWDMMQAGYNPALAYGQQPPSGVSGAQAQWNIDGDPASEVASAKKAWAEATTAATEAEERPTVLKAEIKEIDSKIEANSEAAIRDRKAGYLLDAQTHGQELQNKINAVDAIVGEATAGMLSQAPRWGQAGYGILKNIAPTAASLALRKSIKPARRFGR